MIYYSERDRFTHYMHCKYYNITKLKNRPNK